MHYYPTQRSREGRGDDPIFALAHEARVRAAAGEVIVDATMGILLDEERRPVLLQVVRDVLRGLPPEAVLTYAPIEGLPRYLEAVTHHVLNGDEALIAQAAAVATTGATGALRHAIATVLPPGQTLLTVTPHWPAYNNLCEENGRRLRAVPARSAQGRLAVSEITTALTELGQQQGRLALLLNDPCHNPSGYTLSDEDWQELLTALAPIAARWPLFFLLDLAYQELSESPPRWRHFAPRLLSMGALYLAWSASKSLTGYGLRTGALVVLVPDEQARVETHAALVYACRGTWGNCGHAGMALVSAVLREPARVRLWHEQLFVCRALLQQRRQQFAAAAHTAGLHAAPGEGYFVIVDSTQPEILAARLRTRGVFVVPVEGGVRIALSALPIANIPHLVAVLAEMNKG